MDAKTVYLTVSIQSTDVHQAVSVGTGLRAVMPCGWGVKAGMVRVWVAGKTM